MVRLGLPIAAIALIVYAVVTVRAKLRTARQLVRAVRGDKVVTDAKQPHEGEQATKLALGAMMAVQNREPWNTLVLPSSFRGDTAQMIGNPNSWGIADTDDLMAAVGRMLDEQFGDPDVQVAMAVRRELAATSGRAPSPQAWLADLDRVHNEAGAPQSLLAERRAAAQRVINYETTMLEDGLLTEPLADPLAYDIGRAVALARWGLVCRLIDEATAQGIVDRAAAQAWARYASWDEFGSSYLLGRIIAFDEDEVGAWYETSRTSLQLLRTAPDSPWRLNPWPSTATATPGA